MLCIGENTAATVLAPAAPSAAVPTGLGVALDPVEQLLLGHVAKLPHDPPLGLQVGYALYGHDRQKGKHHHLEPGPLPHPAEQLAGEREGKKERVRVRTGERDRKQKRQRHRYGERGIQIGSTGECGRERKRVKGVWRGRAVKGK